MKAPISETTIQHVFMKHNHSQQEIVIMTTLGNVSTKTLDKVQGFPHDGLTINGVKQKDEN